MGEQQPVPPLVQVTATVQRAASAVVSLAPAVSLISDCVDRSARVSLPHAASSGSISLLERVVTRLVHAPHRSPAMLDHWFARALQVAIEKSDLEMVKAIHGLHPAPLVVKSLELAVQHGDLEMVQWVVAHRCDCMCCAPSVENLCGACVMNAVKHLGGRDALRIIQWLVDEGALLTLTDESDNLFSPLYGPLLKSTEFLQWHDERGLLSEQLAERLLDRAIANERTEVTDAVCKYLVTRGVAVEDNDLVTALVRGSCQRRKEAVIEVVLSSRLCDSFRHDFQYAATRPGGAKVLQWSREWMDKEENWSFMEQMAFYASHFVHVDTVQWLFDTLGLHPAEIPFRKPSNEEDLMLFYQWMKTNNVEYWTTQDMDAAARWGYLDVVQWLQTNSPGRCTTYAMDYAAESGHLHVVQWLHCNRTEGCTSKAVNEAAANGHLHVVKWLCENRSEHNARDAMISAARHGQLEVLEWLYHNQPVDCLSCVTRAVVSEATPDCVALDALKWLEEQPPTPRCVERCSLPPIRSKWLGQYAAADGDLQLLQYIFESFPASQPNGNHDEMDNLAREAAKGGHLPVVQWLFANQ